MNSFLSEIGKKLAERWGALLTVPGLVFLMVLACAHVLGHAHAWDVGLLEDALRDAAAAYDKRPAAAVLAAVGILAAATLAGALARWLAAGVEAALLAPWRRGPAAPLVRWRRGRWARAHRAYLTAVRDRERALGDEQRHRDARERELTTERTHREARDRARAAERDHRARGDQSGADACAGTAEAEERARATRDRAAAAQARAAADLGRAARRLRREAARHAAARNGVALAPPARPTWAADRLHACGERVAGQYGLDLDMVWPRLWITFPDAVRADITAARTGFADACALLAWGLACLLVGAWWYPAALAAPAVLATGWWRVRRSAAALGDLVESGTDLHAARLAEDLGFALPAGWVTPDVGARIRERVRKGA
ncbi:hypothetical protein ACWY4P_06080 [Streptomyces sp. LZ34]